MVFSYYQLSDLTLGVHSKSGHDVYKDAVYIRNKRSAQPAKGKKVVVKRNKQGQEKLSQFEVAFNVLAARFLSPYLTAIQGLVIDQENHSIFGVLSEHLCYSVAKKHRFPLNNVSIKKKKGYLDIDSISTVNRASDISVYFLNEFTSGFISDLFRNSDFTIDYASLASVLSGSYFLEEDDLHKGNLAFYILEKNGKKTVYFQKIDHDLMMANSIMSHKESRITNWYYANHAFLITPESVSRFPIVDSNNHYWPTTKRFFVNYFENKHYSYEDILAFSKLKDNEAFIKQKWLHFYKCCLIPPSVIVADLTRVGFADKTGKLSPEMQNDISLLTQAVVAKQAQLRAALFSLPEFRIFLSTLSDNEKNTLINETKWKTSVTKEFIEDTIKNHQDLSRKIVEKDTPLHVAIRLGDYRYSETIEDFSRYLNDTNADGKTPLDLALEMQNKFNPEPHDRRKNATYIVEHLIRQGANASTAFEKSKKVDLECVYFNEAKKAVTSHDFLKILKKLGRDWTLCLKTKKETAVTALAYYVSTQRNQPDFHQNLREIQTALNAKPNEEGGIGLFFIHQLRSRLWIVRIFRGLFGGTATKSAMNDIINQELNLPFFCCSFFSSIPTEDKKVNSRLAPTHC